MGAILNGKELANKYKEEIKSYVESKKRNGESIPCLTAVLVGDDGGSVFYVNSQRKVCESLGVQYNLIHLEDNVSEEELCNVVKDLNEDSKVNGIILQLPLPKHIDEKKITSLISSEKDVDGLTDINIGRLYKGEKCFIPCTPKAVIEIIKSTGIDIEGKRAVVVGRSNIVGKPVAQLLLNNNATVTICHSRTKNLMEITGEADILVSCTGVPGFITADHVKEGAIVIDVGTSRVNGKMKGDVSFDEVEGKASYITPVPGGVGAMTTTMLILSTCEAHKEKTYRK